MAQQPLISSRRTSVVSSSTAAARPQHSQLHQKMLLVLLLSSNAFNILTTTAANAKGNYLDGDHNNNHNNNHNSNHQQNYSYITDNIFNAMGPNTANVNDGVALIKSTTTTMTTTAAPTTTTTSTTAAQQHPRPHPLRHQVHYSQRIEQAVNDFKRTQSQQLRERDKNLTFLSDRADNRHLLNDDGEEEVDEHGVPLSMATARQQPHHHRRHEHRSQRERDREHLRHRKHQRNHQHHRTAVNTDETSPVGHIPPLRHLRHGHQQGKDQPQPLPHPRLTTESPYGIDNELPRGGGYQPTTSAPMAVATSGPGRYFDRDFESFMQITPRTVTTRGPDIKLRDRIFGDEASEGDNSSSSDDDDDNNDNHLNSKRISLKLSNDHDDGAFDGDGRIDAGGVRDDYVGEDYSYDDESSSKTPSNVFSEEKVAVKRFTNPFKNLNFFWQRPKTQKPETKLRHSHGKKSNDLLDGEDRIDGTDPGFTSQQWQRIESEHHRKQLQHQREMHALLNRHHADGSSHGNEFPPPVAHQQKNHQHQHQHQQHLMVNDDSENIYSRYYTPGTLTQRKQEELGTREAVREQAYKQRKSTALATAHQQQMQKEMKCSAPQRRVVHVQRDASKFYAPPCTVLYRCGDDTGCCGSEKQTCAPKRTQIVDLYFFVTSVTKPKGVEQLTFINHTECHCVDKNRHQTNEWNGHGDRSELYNNALEQSYNCPKSYEKILQEDGDWRCDCSSGNTNCDWFKRGMEHMQLLDRKCIQEGRCKPPTCEYGTYLKKYGRCPRREEQLSAALTGVPNNLL